MKKYLKPAILFVALLLPVVIFLFLKLFGDNKFDIPVYYQNKEEIITNAACENSNIMMPYAENIIKSEIINNTLLSQLKEDKITVLAYYDGENISELTYKLKRLQERLGQDYQMILFADSLQNKTVVNQIVVNQSKNEIDYFWKCTLLNNDYHQWDLLDNKKRIRGYYDGSEKEMDRLIVEMAILIKNNNE